MIKNAGMFVHLLVTANLIILVFIVKHMVVSDEKDELKEKSAPICFHWIH